MKDRINQFIQAAKLCLAQANAAIHAAGPPNRPADFKRDYIADALQRDLATMRQKLLEAGQDLPATLDGNGENNSDLLAFINAVDSLQWSVASSLWPNLQVVLQRMVIKAKPSVDKTNQGGALIERFLAGLDNQILSDDDYAFLCAFLNQPGNRLSLSRLQRGEADPFAKLRLIRKYNGSLRKQSLPKELPRDEGTVNAVAATPDEKTGQGKGNGRKPKTKSRRKRTDPKADKTLSEAWDTGQYKTHADLALAKGITAREVKLAIDRHRKRQAAKGLSRKNPRQ